MLNNSLLFWCFFLAVFAIYWFVARTPRTRLAVLLVANAAFYASWDVRLVWVPVVITYIAFWGARVIASTEDADRRRAAMRNTAIAMILLLVAFRYVGFLRDNLQVLLEWMGASVSLPVIHIPSAVGVSFMTFSALSYTIDVYRETIPAHDSFLRLLASVSMFPITVSGPITRPRELVPQLEGEVSLRGEDFRAALVLITIGLFKKTCADVLGDLVSAAFDGHAALGTANAWACALGFLGRLYADFSGYSDIAIGGALLLGLRVPPNFHRPLLAPSPVQLWRRWHMTLSLWLRDYLFVSLGVRTPYRSLFVTWVLAGVWHGPTWTMVVWGFYNALLILGTTFLTRAIPLKKATLKRIYVARWLLTMYVWLIGIVLFRAPTVKRAWEIVCAMHSASGTFLYVSFATMVLGVATCVVGHLLDATAESGWLAKPRPLNAVVWAGLVWLLLTICMIINPGTRSFIYGSF